jgi:hypothetical protein
MDLSATLEAVREVDIETRDDNDVVRHTTIWPVVEAGKVYVRSLRGTDGRWYQAVSARPDTVLRVGGENLPVRVVPARDPESIAQATAGYRRKYAGSPSLATMIRDEILDSTLRLEPR